MWAGQTIATVLVAVQSLVLIPLYLQRIDVGLYGAWLATGEVLTAVLALDLGVSNLMVQRIARAQGRGDGHAVAAWFGTGVTILAALGVVVLLTGLTVSSWLPAAFGLRDRAALELVRAFRVGLIASGILLVNGGFAAYFRAIQRPLHGALGSIVGTLAMFAITAFALLRLDAGLLAIPYGLVTRAVVWTTYSLVALAAVAPRQGLRRPAFSRDVLKDSLRTMPMATAGGVGFVASGQFDLTIVGLFLGPVAATTLMLARKLADLARAFIDMVSFAVYGPFSHLVGAETGPKAERTWGEIGRIHAAVSVVAAAAYIAGNRAFLSAWVPDVPAGSFALTVLIGIQLLVAAEAFLRNVLYRATGAIEAGSALLAAEAAARLALVAALVWIAGIAAVPISAIAVGVVSGELYRRLLIKTLRIDGASGRLATTVSSPRKAAALALGILAGALLSPSGWALCAVATGTGAAVATLAVGAGNPDLIALVKERALSLAHPADAACTGR